MRRSSLKEELGLELEDISESDNDDIDFSKEIRPIDYYINDREKMIEESFSVTKEEELKKMLPPVMKRYSLEEVEAKCSVHLLGMSKKRIYATLQGRDLNNSSDSEADSSNSVLGSDSSEKVQITSSTHTKSDVEEIDDTLDISVSKNDLDSLMRDRHSQPNTSRKRRSKSKSSDLPNKKIKSEISPSLIEISNEKMVSKKKKKDKKRPKKKTDKKFKHKHSKEKPKKAKRESSHKRSDKEETTYDGSVLIDSKKGKSLLEILELEMRARAIRALLGANASTNSVESTPKLKQDPEVDENKGVEKVHTSTDVQAAENSDESDSCDVEIINDNCNEEIIILDDIDEQISLEPDDKSESLKKEPSKSVSLGKEPWSSDLPEEESDLPDDKVPQSDSTSNNPLDTSDSNLTRPERWTESKGAKEIIQNSKLNANIRKRMRFAEMLKQKEKEQQQLPPKVNQPENPLISEPRLVEESSVD